MRQPSRSAPARPKARGKTAPSRKSTTPTPEKWQPFQKRLVELRDTLLAHNRDLLQDAREPIGTAGSHVAEIGTDEFDRNQSLRIAASEQGVLQEIDEALNRIKRGTYGICEISGKRIPAARLKIVPWTRYTAVVEAEREKRGTGNRLPVREATAPTRQSESAKPKAPMRRTAAKPKRK